jgi:hypothetical protein
MDIEMSGLRNWKLNQEQVLPFNLFSWDWWILKTLNPIITYQRVRGDIIFS